MNNPSQFPLEVPGVSELTSRMKTLLEGNFQDVLVEGELSNVKESRNGHVYFTVKDSEAQLPCVMWNSTKLRLQADPRDGQQVILGGDIQLYPPHGRYQLIVSLVQQAGTGKLQKKFEELKRKLESEGLFSDIHKKPLPQYPFRIAVITSATGAAFQDIRDTFEKRWPVATLILHHVSVQGVYAAGEIADAFHYFSEQDDPPDLIIAGRGGGSLEDLWPFNEEIVARAIFECPIPVISAVGHETDFSISDFVADVRAATPTQAVILSAPDINELRYIIDDYTSVIEKTLKQQIQYYRDYIHRLTYSHALLAVLDKIKYYRSYSSNLTDRLVSYTQKNLKNNESRHASAQFTLRQFNPLHKIEQQQSELRLLTTRLHRNFHQILQTKKASLNPLQTALAVNNPAAPLEKGFTRILQHGIWVKSQSRYNPGSPVEIEWKDGRVTRD